MLTPEEFQMLLPFACAQDTAYDGGKGWTPENPTFGHCAVAALVVQDLFGGDLLCTSLEGTAFAESRSHYFNRLPDGTNVDVTAAQFGGKLPKNLPARKRLREHVLNGGDTQTRYRLLKQRINGILLERVWNTF